MLDPLLQPILTQAQQSSLALADLPIEAALLNLHERAWDKPVVTLSDFSITDQDEILLFSATADQFLGVQNQQLTFLFYVADSVVHALVKVSLPADWSLERAYPFLPTYTIMEGGAPQEMDSFFYDLPLSGPIDMLLSTRAFSAADAPADKLTSLSYSLAPEQHKIVAGFNFVSSLDLTTFSLLDPLWTFLPAGIGRSFTIIGTVTAQPGANELQLEFPISGFTTDTYLELFSMGIAGLVFTTSTYSQADNPGYGIGLLGGIHFGPNPPVTAPENLEVIWPIGSTELIIKNIEEIPFPGLSTFATLLEDNLPAADSGFLHDLASGDALVIREFMLVLSLSGDPVPFVSLGIGPPDSWQHALIGSVLSIDDILLRWDIRPGHSPAVQFYVFSDWLLAGGMVQVSALFPDMVFNGALALGESIHFESLLESIFPASGLPAITISDLSLSADTKASIYQFTIDLSTDWELDIAGISVLPLKRIKLGIDKEPDQTAITVSGSLSIGRVDLMLEASNANDAGNGWSFEGSSGQGQEIPIGELMEDVAEQFGLGENSFPAALESMVIENVKVAFNTGTKDFFFTFTGLLFDPLYASLIITLQLTKNENNQYHKYFSGELHIGERRFDLIFDSETPDSQILLAAYQKAGGDEVQLSDLLGDILPADTGLGNLSLTLKSALMALDKESVGEGEGARVTKYLFTANVDLGIDLSGLQNLPLVGGQLSGDNALTLALQPIYSSSGDKKLTAEELGRLSDLTPEGSPNIPNNLGNGGPGLITTISWGSFQKVINLGVAPSDVSDQLPADNPVPPPAGNETPPPGKPQWSDVNKGFGGLNLSRLGVSYKDQTISVLLDGSIHLGPLNVALMGLGASYHLGDTLPTFSLDGLALSYQQPPIEIGGAFLKMDDDFVGQAHLKMETFGISALGAFSEIDGHPSFFLYAFLDYPLGGPSFFFVTGLAIGFGYNRRLETPPITELRQFPLIADVIGTAPAGAPTLPAGSSPTQTGAMDNLRAKFTLLEEYIYPQDGQYFLAAGIKFSSFELIESFALLTVGFGQHFDLGIMGFSKASIPSEVPNPLAEVELVFSIRFEPEEGFLGANAILTTNSYILSRDCFLQGGFAFYCWFKGEHRDDFVVTLGGYHPDFTPPSHYPQAVEVPRLGFNWKVSDMLSLKGGMYFALCPKAMMAGGFLEATFKLGKSGDFLVVDAGFKVAADFLIYWKPFQYQATASIEMHAEITLDFALFSVGGGISAGAELKIWGPEFAGTADVHAKVLGFKANFTVDFGEELRAIEKLLWAEFSSSFLPVGDDKRAPTLSLAAGLVKTVEELWIINPKELQLAISTITPLTTAAGMYQADGDTTFVAIPNFTDNTSSLHVDPMGASGLYAQLGLRLEHKQGDDWVPAFNAFKIQPFTKKFPRALWTDTLSTGATPDPNGEQMISANGGYLILPGQPPKSDSSHDFLVSVLEFEVEWVDVPTVTLPQVSMVPQGDLQADDLAGEAAASRRALLTSLQLDTDQVVRLRPGLEKSYVLAPQTIELSVA